VGVKDIKRCCLALVILLSGVCLGACSSLSSTPVHTATPTIEYSPTITQHPTDTPTSTITPTNTPFPTATPTPTSTPTPLLLVAEGTPLPDTLPIINVISAPDVSGLAEWRVPGLTDLSWTADGSSLAAATVDSIELYDIITREKWRSLHPEYYGIREIAFSPNGLWLTSGSYTGTEETGYITYLERWWGLDMKPYGLFGTQFRGMSDMEFAANSLTLFTAFSTSNELTNSTEFWDTYEWEITGTLFSGLVLDISISQFGELLATSPDRYAIQIWDLKATGSPLHTIYTSFTGAVTQAVFSPSGELLATGHYDGLINIWDVASGTLLRTIATEAVVQSLAFSPDGSLLATGHSYEDNLINVWWVDAGSLLTTLPGHDTGVDFLLFSPLGDMLVSGSYDGSVRVWGIRP